MQVPRASMSPTEGLLYITMAQVYTRLAVIYDVVDSVTSSSPAFPSYDN